MEDMQALLGFGNLPPKLLLGAADLRSELARRVPGHMPPAALLAISLTGAEWQRAAAAAASAAAPLFGAGFVQEPLPCLQPDYSSPAPSDSIALSGPLVAQPTLPVLRVPRMQLAPPKPKAAPAPSLAAAAAPPEQPQLAPQLARSLAYEAERESCPAWKSMAHAEAGSPRKAGSVSDSGSRAGPLPSLASLYAAACTLWPGMGFRLLAMAVPLLLLLPYDGTSASRSVRLQADASWPASPLPAAGGVWILLPLCLAVAQLLCARWASNRASWRMAMATDACHLALVAVISANAVDVLLLALVLLVPRLLIVGSALCRTPPLAEPHSPPKQPTSPLQPARGEQLHVTRWQRRLLSTSAESSP